MVLINTSRMIAVGMLAAFAAADAAATPRQSSTITEDYRARYDRHRDVYCIRIFAEPPAALPQPGPSRDTCQSRAAWAREGLQVDRVPRADPG